ncbi:phosphotriesterase family protein [Actinotignum sp. GS-2025a]|uniref:phosphotriesterase family protein n=1 Tax=Actinotignum TaxID=1653174 RepID=UPI000F7F8B9B|nr:phosphotriesterase [Actinotignum sanguinis]MDY5147913.1 phosphotriesterase [Actinotignum sanguinis]RTE49127.1 phosphotriesterase-related protein [Actinotignum sanguinis]
MSQLKSGELQTVRGIIKAQDMGMTLPHEHLFNDLSSVVDEPYYEFSKELVGKKVTPDLMYGLRQDPYCNADNMADKPAQDVILEVRKFAELGGQTIVDATGTVSIGRNPARLLKVAEATGLNVVMSAGPYLEKFEGERITARGVDAIAEEIDADINEGIPAIDTAPGSAAEKSEVGDPKIKAGMIGEIGVSPFFTEGEHASLLAGALAQTNNPSVALNIHIPGWQRRGDEVLDLVFAQGVAPHKVSLAHSDPSGADKDYQRRLLDRGVWLEFDMIGLDITFPKEGVSPSVNETVSVLADLIADGYADQIILSHDLFLKQMWTQNGGNGFAFVPTVVIDLLRQEGVSESDLHKLLYENPAKVLTA